MNFNNIRLRSLLVVLVCSFAVFTTAAKGVFYVKVGAEGDGSSWSSAFGDIQQAVDSAAKKGADVWVAKGTYTSDATAVVDLKPNVSLYGGFAGTETSLADRDTAKNPTIIDGRKGRRGINQEKAFDENSAVVVDGFTIQNGSSSYYGGAYLRKNTTINNCIFKSNFATGYGLALYAEYATIKNCIICDNNCTVAYQTVRLNNSVMDSCVIKNNRAYYTSGLYAYYSTVSNTKIDANIDSNKSGEAPVYLYDSKLINCELTNNSGRNAGVKAGSSSLVSGCTISNNKSTNNSVVHIDFGSSIEDSEIFDNEGVDYEIVYVFSSSKMNRCKVYNNVVDNNHNIVNILKSSTLSNSLIYGNKNLNSSSSPLRMTESSKMINSTFVDNETGASSAFSIANSSVINSIVVGTKFANTFVNYVAQEGTNTFSHSMVEGGVAGEGNISGSKALASFVDSENGDYSLSETSYCINAGTDVEESVDLLGGARKQNDAVDMGAIESKHEKAAIPSIAEILYVKEGSQGDGTSWKSALGDIDEAIKMAARDGKRHQIWVAAGTYFGDTTSSGSVLYLEKGIDLYGGFAGSETSLTERDTAKNPTVIDGKNARRVISQNYVFDDIWAVVVDGFTIQNGSAENGGGAYIQKNATICNCIVKGNSASNYGSAVYAIGSRIKKTQIIGNTYTSSARRTVFLNNSIMDSCVVKNNRAYEHSSVYAEKNSKVSNCEFGGNSNRYNDSRGAYFNASNASDCKFGKTKGSGSCAEIQNGSIMSNCVFEEITGASEIVLYVGGKSLADSCQFLRDTTSSDLIYLYNGGKLNRCSVIGNSVSGRLVYTYYSSPTVSNSLFINNKCTGSNDPFYVRNGLMVNCTVADNTFNVGQIIHLDNSTLKNSIVVGNKRPAGFGSILRLEENYTVSHNMLDATVIGTDNIDGTMKLAAFTDPENGDYSLSEQSYCINAGDDVDDAVDLLGNPRSQGGAVDMGAIESAYKDAVSFVKCGEIVYVKENSEGDGSSWESAFGSLQDAMSAASADNQSHQIWVAAGTYTGDSTLSYVVNLSRGISLYGGFAGTETSIADRDTAKNPTILDGGQERMVISQNYEFPESMPVVIDGFIIQNGKAVKGAGVNISKNTTVRNCIIRNNVASDMGMALCAYGATVKNCQIYGNSYADYGEKVVYLNKAVFDSCVVKNNTARYHSSIYAENGSRISNSLFESNKSVYSYYSNRNAYFNSSIIENCQFVNSTGRGGAVDAENKSTMRNCLFADNTNVEGNVLCIGSNSVAEDCQILNNQSVGDLLVATNSSQIRRFKVSGNKSGGRILSSNSSVTISNSEFSNNECTYTAEPFYLHYKTSMINCTVVKNSTMASKFVSMGNSSALNNSILVGNTFANGYGYYFNFSTNDNIVSYSMVEGGADGVGNLVGSMSLAAFANADSADYSLSSKSLCINAGADVEESLDLLGNERKQSDAVDMGAIESSYDSFDKTELGEIVYVKADSKGDGTSWDSAFGDIQEAVVSASLDGKRHQIWVAAGTYYGDTTLSDVVSIEKGISLYGGFEGNETSLAARDTAKNPTIIDGKNKRRVISQNYAFPDSMAVVVDGFTIQNGYAVTGGGAYLRKNTTLNNCIVKNCLTIESGIAIYAIGSNITNCVICDNGDLVGGINMIAPLYMSGGKADSCVIKNNKAYSTSSIYATDSVRITNCLIEGNESAYHHTMSLNKYASMYDCKIINNINKKNNDYTIYMGDNVVVDRCLFDGNESYRYVFHLNNSSVVSNSQITNNKSRGTNLMEIESKSKVINCTIADNVSNNQTVYCYSGTQILNSIIVGNKRTNNSESIYVNGATIAYSMVEGGANGVGNIDGSKSSAAFKDAAKGDYSLSETSLCINAGTDVDEKFDLLGNVRKQGDAVDMGAFESEFTEKATVGTVIYVKAESDGSGTSWDDALGDINNAITLASSTGRQHQIWVAAGTYYGDTSLTSAISLSAGVSLYGGFAGTETSLDERDAATNTTVIDGRYKRRCIIQNYDFDDLSAIVVDGFTIQNGYMNSGAGVNAKTMGNTTFKNCIFRNARAGYESVYANKSAFVNCTFADNKIQDLHISEGVVDSCIFTGNTTTQYDRCIDMTKSVMSNSQVYGNSVSYGILSASDNSRMTRCKIYNNQSNTHNAISISSSTLDNSLVYGNVIKNSGYSVIAADYSSFITNSTIAHNTTKDRSAVSYASSSSKKFTTIANCIIYGNKVTDDVRPQVVVSDYMKIMYSASDGDLTGENNIRLASANSGSDASKNYVCFINAAGGDYRLHATSSCIDKGLDSEMTATLDVNGGARIYGKAIDLGAIEFDGEYVQMFDYSQVICHNGTSLEATFDSTISMIDWAIEYAGHVTGFEETSGTGLSIPAMQLNTSKSDVDTLTLKVTPYDKAGVVGAVFNYNYIVYPDFSKKKVTFARPQVAYVVNEQNSNMTIEWNLLKLPVEVDNYDLYVWKASQKMPTVPMASYVKEHVKNLSGLDNHTTYKYMVKAAIACDTICSDVDSFRIDIPVSLEVNGNVNCVFGSKLNETSSLTRYVKGFELTDSITYEITGKDAADFSAKYENGWDKLKGGYLRIYYTPTDVKKQTSDAEITIRSGKSGKYEITLYLAGTLSNYYVYDAVVSKDIYHAGDTVDVVGVLTDAYGSPIPGKTLTVEAKSNTGFSHSSNGVTDSVGNALVRFATDKSECGTYSVKVYIGTKTNDVTFAQFDIPGMAYTGGTTKWTIQKGDTIEGTITIKNKSSVDLHNLVVEARELADGLSVEFDTIDDLKGGESARIPFKATGTKLSEGNKYIPSVFRVYCDENTTCDFSTYFYCEHPYGQIKVLPVEINEYVSKQKPKYINVMLTNAGFGETGDITLNLPEFEGFSLSNTNLPSIKSGDTINTLLKISYFADAPINVPYTGTIAVNCANGKSTSLPFRIEYSSESKGSLEVDVVDEYFYNTSEKKHLRGAEVVVRNQYNNNVFASGITDSTGIVRFDSIPEGSYLMSVKADKHSEFQQTIEIQAGQQLEKFVFLNYKAITYNWKVERVEIEDKYDIKLDLEYETNVPVPVVTLSYPNGVPDKERFEVGVPKTLRLQITNHGLIAAHYVKFRMPKCPYYRFYAPYNYIDSLPANHTEFIPITIVRTSDKYGTEGISVDIKDNLGHLLEDESSSSDTSACPKIYADYYYYCKDLNGDVSVAPNVWGCPSIKAIEKEFGGFIGGGLNLPDYYSSSFNSHGYDPVLKNNGHVVNWDLPCNTCESKIDPWDCIGDLLFFIPGFSYVQGKLSEAIEEDAENKRKKRSLDVKDHEPEEKKTFMDKYNDAEFGAFSDFVGNARNFEEMYMGRPSTGLLSEDGPLEEFNNKSFKWLERVQKISKSADLIRRAYFDDDFDPGEGLDFVYDEGKDLLDDKLLEDLLPVDVPWGCLDLTCQWHSCKYGRYASNCARFWLDRKKGLNEEDPDTRTIETIYGDKVEIVDGEIADILYSDGTRLSEHNRPKKLAIEAAKFNLKNSFYQNADKRNLALHDAVEYIGFKQYRRNLLKELAGSDVALTKNGIIEYFDYTIRNYSHSKKIEIDSIKKLPTIDLSTTEMLEMAQRWNETLVANENGVYSPNEQYPNIVDRNVISMYMDSVAAFYTYLKLRGLGDTYELMTFINNVVNDKSSHNGVCASVKLQISQTLTMTREAFDGTLSVNNGNESGAMEGFEVVLEIRDENGNVANDLFQINTEKLIGVTAVDGTGEIAPKSEGTALFRFIPEKGAAPTSPVNYSFGGYIVYVDPSSGDTVKADLYPVTLTVNPSPDLQIDYFMQRNILGDDALTEDRVEPSVPAALGVRIDNQGYGVANNVKLETAQPEIVDNEKGLLIDFAIIGSSLNGKDCNLGSENINFGNIEALSAKTGVWWMTSSLLGHFTKYEASVVHANSFGNPELSLVKGIAIHELIKTVDAYGVKEDNVTDFLVNDIKDDDDTPDAIYYSNGGVDTVNKAQRANVDKKKLTSSTDTIVKLTVIPSKAGWNYAQMDDPGDNCFEIKKVVRVKDSVEIPLDNVWTTFVTLPDGGEPVYVNRLHFLDYMTTLGENDYNIYYSVNKNVLNVAELLGTPKTEVAVTSPVDSVIVKFDHKIQKESFDYNDIELFCQGGDNLSDSTITVVQRDDYTYVVNIASKTTKSGFYRIEVNVNNVYDQNGYPGNLGKNATWSQLIDDVILPDTTVSDSTGGNGNIITPVADVINDEFAVYASKGCVYVKSTKSGTVDVYDVLSRLIVKSAPYREGVTMVATLPKGIYIIEGKKIIVR